ncbi:Cytochrome P450 704C1, partial [Mucuna pruriens]
MNLRDFLSATITAVILVAIFIKIHGSGFFDKKRKYHPVAGTVIHQMFNFHRLLEYMIDLASQRKTYRLLSFTRNEVYTSNPVNIEHILTTNFPNYGKDGKRKTESYP